MLKENIDNQLIENHVQPGDNILEHLQCFSTGPIRQK